MVIYQIHIELGHGIFLMIEDRKDNPITLEPYGAYYQNYGPVLLYEAGGQRAAGMLDNPSTKKRIMLSTSSGRYYAKRNLELHTHGPVLDGLLKNYWSGVISPIRRTYKDVHLGSEIQYIVTLTDSDGKETVMSIDPGAHRIRQFRGFMLTEEALESAQDLKAYLEEQVDKGNLTAQEIEVFDPELEISSLLNRYGRTLEIPTYGWFKYNVVYRGYTLWGKAYEKATTIIQRLLSR